MKKKCISLLIILFIVACDQRMISIKSGIKTMVTAPLTLLKDTRNIITGNTYDKLKTNTQKNEENEDLVTVKCNNIITASIIDSPEEIKKLSSEVRKHACSCEVWGTCPKNICSCDKLCPWSFELFRRKDRKNLKDYSLSSNSLAFRNKSSNFRHISDFKGFCAGHAGITQKFNRLSFFRENQRAPFDLNSSNQSEQKKAVDFYRQLIKKVSLNKVAIIPGFKNLKEFSTHPSIQEVLKDEVGREWAEENHNFENIVLQVRNDLTDMSKSQSVSLFKEIKERIDNHMQPKVWFTDIDTHVVLISHYEIDHEGNIVLWPRDNNVSPRRNHSCLHKITINKSGEVQHSKRGKLRMMRLSPTEDSNTVEQVNALRAYCHKEKDC